MDETKADSGAWEAGTWEGARRAQIRRALKRTLRERLEALEELAETSRRLEAMRKKKREGSE
jgi:hypothetical protein